MAVLTAHVDRPHFTSMELRDWPVAASETIYRGSYVGLNPAGYLKTFEPCDLFVGISYQGFDNSAGSAAGREPTTGDPTCKVYVEGDFELPLASIALTDRGKPVYATNDGTLSLTGHPDAFVGTLLHYETSTTGVVRLKAPGQHAPLDGSSIDIDIDFASWLTTLQDETAAASPHLVTGTGIIANCVGAGLTAGASGLENIHGTADLSMLLDNDNEAQNATIETHQVFNITKGVSFELFGRNKTAGGAATDDWDFGLAGIAASGLTDTERADMDAATATFLKCLYHVDMNALDIFATSDDNSSPITATNTTIDNSLTVNKLHRINCRVDGSCELWIDSVQVLAATAFSVGAAGLLAGVCNVEKSTGTGVPEVRVRRFRTAGAFA